MTSNIDASAPCIHTMGTVVDDAGASVPECIACGYAPDATRARAVTYGLAFERYVELSGWNFSTLKAAAKSPLHYRHARANPRADTPSLRLGRATHVAVLEPDRYASAYVVMPAFGDMRTKAAKAARDDWYASHAGIKAEPLDADDDAFARAMSAAVRANADAASLLATGVAEVSITWLDARTGRLLKCRIDWLDLADPSRPRIVELKTTRTIAPSAFAREAAQRLYHAQLGMQAAAVEAAFGAWPSVHMIAAENEAPHDVVVYDVPDEALVEGLRLAGGWVASADAAERSGVWPGCSATRRALELPAWALVGAEVTMGGESIEEAVHGDDE